MFKETKGGTFDAQLIENRLKQIRLMEPKPYRQLQGGMFKWENNIRNSKVEWVCFTK